MTRGKGLDRQNFHGTEMSMMSTMSMTDVMSMTVTSTLELTEECKSKMTSNLIRAAILVPLVSFAQVPPVEMGDSRE